MVRNFAPIWHSWLQTNYVFLRSTRLWKGFKFTPLILYQINLTTHIYTLTCLHVGIKQAWNSIWLPEMLADALLLEFENACMPVGYSWLHMIQSRGYIWPLVMCDVWWTAYFGRGIALATPEVPVGRTSTAKMHGKWFDCRRRRGSRAVGF